MGRMPAEQEREEDPRELAWERIPDGTDGRGTMLVKLPGYA